MGVLPAQLPNTLGNSFPPRRALRVRHIDKNTSVRRGFLSMPLLEAAQGAL